MADRKQKDSGEHKEQADVETDVVQQRESEASAADSASSQEAAGVPRWRQIEVMHERAQLRKMLDDLVMDFDELEMEVFGSDAEHDLMYRHLDDEDEEEPEEELEISDADDDFEDDDFKDLEE